MRLITLTHALVWRENFGEDASALRTVREDEFRKILKADLGTSRGFRSSALLTLHFSPCLLRFLHTEVMPNLFRETTSQ